MRKILMASHLTSCPGRLCYRFSASEKNRFQLIMERVRQYNTTTRERKYGVEYRLEADSAPYRNFRVGLRMLARRQEGTPPTFLRSGWKIYNSDFDFFIVLEVRSSSPVPHIFYLFRTVIYLFRTVIYLFRTVNTCCFALVVYVLVFRIGIACSGRPNIMLDTVLE